MVVSVVDQLEDLIRTTAQTKRVRPSEFFIDYDRLRSGYVTESQFFRVLWENLCLKFTDEEQQLLSNKYNTKNDGRIHYKQFCQIVDRPFNPHNFQGPPEDQKVEAPEFLGTMRSLRPLSPDSETKLERILFGLVTYYKYRGLNLRTSCEDFDRHHIGVINETQFYRSFPRPPEVQEPEIDLIVRKYRDPDRPGLINYLNLHHDIVALGQRCAQADALPQNAVNPSDFLAPLKGADLNLQAIFDKIRVAVFKNRVRTIEFFRDYDKLRSGVITEHQFVCGLSLAIGKEAQLSRSEIQKIVEFYRVDSGRVAYKEFCDMMENAFNIPDLDKKPTQSVVRPPQGALGRNLCELSADEEQRLHDVINTLRSEVRKKRIMMYQYFKDYDRSKAYSRVITPTQFGRILHFLSLNVASEDFKLLCRKFVDHATGDVNYPAFVQCVDSDFVNYTQSSPADEREPAPYCAGDVRREEPVVDTSGENLDQLMARIRHIVLTNRKRVCEYFTDFDSLRSGYVTKSQFRRGLSDLGLSALGQHTLTEPQFQLLCDVNAHPSMKDKVSWTRFCDAVESVFTQANLEKNPTHVVPPQELFVVPKPGTTDWSMVQPEHASMLNDVMDRLRQRSMQRRILLKPVFQDFDRHNNGHLTRQQFRQCLSMLELTATAEEMKALEAKFCNDVGFNYLAFLEELQPTEKRPLMYIKRMEELRATNDKCKLPERDPAADLEAVLLKVKTMVFKEKMRIHEWMRDYDKLRSGRMLCGNFRRALDLCKFQLTESELAILEDHYRSPGRPDFVDWLRFSDDIELIFTTKELEKAPLLEVTQFRPQEEWTTNALNEDLDPLFINCMNRIADKVKKGRVQLFPLFEDYDRVHNGTVSRSQFRRVLNELQLASLVSTELEWLCLWRRFDVKIGGKDDVNYVAFCDMVYEIAKFEWRKP